MHLRSARGLAALILIVATACGGKAAPAPGGGGAGTGVGTGAATGAPAEPRVVGVVAPVYRTLAAEETITTAWQATLKAPAGWHVAVTDDVVRLQEPDRELSVALLVSAAGDRDAAIAEGWAKVQPGFDLAVAQAFDLGALDGWDAVAQVVYVTPEAEGRVVVAVARRIGAAWHLALIDGAPAALDRRGAQLNAIILDMEVPGVDTESYAGRPAQLDEARLQAWGDFVEEARAMTGVPGAAVAVVHGGKIVYERGFGVRALGGKKPKAVTPSTVFMIGSTTKSLTTLLLARLVDQGKLAWDMAVTQVLPSFALADAAVTAAVQVQHTVCACTGMPRQDLEFLFDFDGWEPEARLASMAKMKPTTGFGETFQYSNVMVATGGWVAARAYAPKKKLGPAYDEAMQKLVFGPLKMKTATFDAARAQKGDHALPHAQGLSADYAPSPLALERGVDSVRPAGGAWASVRDLAQYALLELAGGKTPDGKVYVSEANLLERRKPRVQITADEAYGLGLFVSRAKDVLVVHHGGNMIGYTADFFLLPDHDVGVVVLTNAGGANAMRGAVRARFLELVFDGKAEAKDHLAETLARVAQERVDEATRHAAPDEAWIAPLLGRYESPDLGRLELRAAKGGGYELDVGEWQSGVLKRTARDGTVKVMTSTGAFAGLEWTPREVDGQPALVLEAGQHTYVFTRAAAAAK